MNEKNVQVLLARRPKEAPQESDFHIVETAVPGIRDGQFLVHNHYLSLDPYMRGRMNDAKSYAKPVGIGEVMEGEAAGEVIASRHAGFKPGDKVVARTGWQTYGVSDGTNVRKIESTDIPVSAHLGVVGMPGRTAYIGLLDIGQPKSGETVVVSAASGAVGSVVGQIAKIKGCRAVGIAGGREKCRYGGEILDTVLRRLNPFARIPLCGLISQYNLAEPYGLKNFGALLINRAKLQGFIVSDHAARYPAANEDLERWLREGRLKYRESVVEGLRNAPKAFIGLLSGKNLGKQLIKLV